MSTLKVDVIESYSGGNIGTNNNLTVTGNLDTTGTITSDNYVYVEGGAQNTKGFFTPSDALSNFNGASLITANTPPVANLFLYRSGSSNASCAIIANSYTDGYVVDELIQIQSDINTGITFSDWGGTWLTIPYAGSPTYSRKVTINNALKLEPQDPLPAGALGELAVSGSSLYFHNGTSWGVIS